MKKLIWILVFILIGCSSEENEVENIEFMAYTWSVEMPLNKAKPKFKTECEIYSVLNINGKNKTYFLNYEPNKVEEYFESTVDKKIIDSLIHYSNKLSENSKSEIKYDSNIGCIKAPPILRLKINYRNKTSKSYYYNFIQNDKEYLSIKKLYTELRVNRIEKNYRKTKMDSDLINRKNKFIKWTTNEDTLNSYVKHH